MRSDDNVANGRPKQQYLLAKRFKSTPGMTPKPDAHRSAPKLTINSSHTADSGGIRSSHNLITAQDSEQTSDRETRSILLDSPLNTARKPNAIPNKASYPNSRRSSTRSIQSANSIHSVHGLHSKPTKMFRKYFERQSLATSELSSHNSIWTESESSNVFGGDGPMLTSDNSDDDPFVLTMFNCDTNSHDVDSEHDNRSHHNGLSPVVLPQAVTTQIVPAHLLDMSFASTVSLGSDYSHYATDNETETQNSAVNLLAVQEENEIDVEDGDSALLSFESSSGVLSAQSNKSKKKRKRPQIHQLLLDASNQPSSKPISEQWSMFDSFAMDMMPEPTAMEKLKYHLTEARLPPTRRKTYNYSHI